ncbi:hypothetical protein PNC201_14010 [Pseudoalteromonas sp. NC201]|nr:MULTISPECIES: type II toxin-antitoxin system antitoxin SocA domain-containing protein [Pseudoalteromonas]AUJ71056.1 hypothetical protein PNC201_14010 [Pseudoalteromonas sp. NC201]MCG7552912.1 DUF4065 domain-containing protein [Pseudoalteromonas sp. Of11M-6]
MGYPAKVIANAFLDKAEQAGTTLTPMKLQKLIYYAHGWYLAIKNQPLIDEYIEAWDYGPVVSSVYSEFRNFGAAPIYSRATLWDQQQQNYVVPKPKQTDCDLHSLIDAIWNSYSQYDALKLSEMTHLEGAPWHTVKKKYPDFRNVQIPNEVIFDYFSAMLPKEEVANS